MRPIMPWLMVTDLSAVATKITFGNIYVLGIGMQEGFLYKKIKFVILRDGENRGMSFLSDLVPFSSSTGSKHLSSSSNSQSTLASSTNSRQSKASSSSLNSSPSLSPSHGGGGGGGGEGETRLSRVIRSLQVLLLLCPTSSFPKKKNTKFFF